MLDTRLPEVWALSALRAVAEQAPHTPILPHPTFINPQVRHAARQRGAFDVAVRGGLKGMWGALPELPRPRGGGPAAEPGASSAGPPGDWRPAVGPGRRM